MQPHRNAPGRDDTPWLRRLAGRVAGSGRADDLAQETLLAALIGREPTGQRRRWLAGILRNVARMERRTRLRRERREARAARNGSAPSVVKLLERDELKDRILAALDDLPEPHRAAVEGRYLLGRSCASLAREAGVPTSTMRNRLRRGLAMLRTRIEREYGGDPRALSVVALIGGERLAASSAIGHSRPDATRPAGRSLRIAIAAGILALLGFALPSSAGEEAPAPLPEPAAATPETPIERVFESPAPAWRPVAPERHLHPQP